MDNKQQLAIELFAIAKKKKISMSQLGKLTRIGTTAVDNLMREVKLMNEIKYTEDQLLNWLNVVKNQ